MTIEEMEKEIAEITARIERVKYEAQHLGSSVFDAINKVFEIVKHDATPPYLIPHEKVLYIGTQVCGERDTREALEYAIAHEHGRLFDIETSTLTTREKLAQLVTEIEQLRRNKNDYRIHETTLNEAKRMVENDVGPIRDTCSATDIIVAALEITQKKFIPTLKNRIKHLDDKLRGEERMRSDIIKRLDKALATLKMDEDFRHNPLPTTKVEILEEEILRLRELNKLQAQKLGKIIDAANELP